MTHVRFAAAVAVALTLGLGAAARAESNNLAAVETLPAAQVIQGGGMEASGGSEAYPAFAAARSTVVTAGRRPPAARERRRACADRGLAAARRNGRHGRLRPGTVRGALPGRTRGGRAPCRPSSRGGAPRLTQPGPTGGRGVPDTGAPPPRKEIIPRPE